MKRIIFLASLLFSTQIFSAPSYVENSFTKMPHYKIMELNINECNVQANGAGDPSAAQECISNQQKSFDYLKRIHDSRDITSPSWSLCIAESKTRFSYNYLVMLACMKVVKEICPEREDGYWKNPNLCINSIESGAWMKNPKIFEPTKYSTN